MEQIVQHQVLLWHARQQASREAPQTVATHWPVVTISREFGVAGSRIGERLAELLGFDLWDARVLEVIAEKLKSSVSDLGTVDERMPGAIEEFLSIVLHVADVPRLEFHDALRHLVRTLERTGSAVIVGRGAGLIVTAPKALRVRLTAPLEHRIESYARHEVVDLNTARTRVLRADKERRGYIERHFDTKVDDPLNYDFVLNVTTTSVDRTAEALREMYRFKFGKVPEPSRRSSATLG